MNFAHGDHSVITTTHQIRHWHIALMLAVLITMIFATWRFVTKETEAEIVKVTHKEEKNNDNSL